MKPCIRILLIFISLTIAVQTKADSWLDPTWKEMLDNSNVIALIEYTTSGEYRAGAKILKVYKGQLKPGDEIFITGFSNRYGPIDSMQKGDTYVVFIGLNKPTKDGIKYWSDQLKKSKDLKGFVEAYKESRAYHVASPTSGDLKVENNKVQYDLVQTSFYSNQKFFALTEFEEFLVAYQNKDKAGQLCKRILPALHPVNESDSSTQTLMKLFLLGYKQYENIFESYITVTNPSSKYALALLLGNIKSEQSTKALIELLNDKNSLVQGEVVRQLKHGSPEIIAPILLKHLKSSGDENFGPSNVMDPVMNTIDGGKIEIIQTLREFKYKPAIPDLLLLLDTEDEGLFGLVIQTLKDIGSREYIPYINKHLDNKNESLIFKISMMIAEDSLTECLPSFKNFISTCNRNSNTSYEYTISECCGIAHFKDSTTQAFLLADFERFFTYKDSLESSRQKYWANKYIITFANLKTKAARPLIYRSIYDWYGIGEEFGKNSKLFKIKKQAEDSVKNLFANSPQKQNYRLDNCIAFIKNPAEVVTGQIPLIKYLVEVTIPSNDNGDEYQDSVVKQLNLPGESVYIRFENGIYHMDIQDRFNKDVLSGPISEFLEYAQAVPDPSDLAFLESILDNNFVKDEYDTKRIRKAIKKVKESLHDRP